MNNTYLEYIMAILLGVLLILVAIPITTAWFTIRYWRISLAVLILLVLASWAWSAPQESSGFVLRGVLEDASSDGQPYFKIGDALVFTMPRDSALAPPTRTLVGKQVVITLLEK